MTAKQQESFERTREIDKLNSRFESLEKEIDGSDGRPKFDRKEVRNWVKQHPEYAHPDPLRVYKVIHEEKLDAWKIDQVKKKEKGTHIEKGQAKREPEKKDISKLSGKEYDDYVRSKYADKVSN